MGDESSGLDMGHEPVEDAAAVAGLRERVEIEEIDLQDVVGGRLERGKEAGPLGREFGGGELAERRSDPVVGEGVVAGETAEEGGGAHRDLRAGGGPRAGTIPAGGVCAQGDRSRRLVEAFRPTADSSAP